jgi:pimeloyl-ACP methyl ester carboxylesterase
MAFPLTRRVLLGGFLGNVLAPYAQAAPVPFQRRVVRVSGLGFPLLTWGEDGARPVMLLHGFPQDPWTWQPVAEALARAGFQAIVPWLRGYAVSNRAEPYNFAQLSGDCLGIGDVLGLKQLDVVGFGIGGALAWMLAACHPQRVSAIASMRYPHPAAFAHAMEVDPEQRKKWLLLQGGAASPTRTARRPGERARPGVRRSRTPAGPGAGHAPGGGCAVPCPRARSAYARRGRFARARAAAVAAAAGPRATAGAAAHPGWRPHAGLRRAPRTRQARGRPVHGHMLY